MKLGNEFGENKQMKLRSVATKTLVDLANNVSQQTTKNSSP